MEKMGSCPRSPKLTKFPDPSPADVSFPVFARPWVSDFERWTLLLAPKGLFLIYKNISHYFCFFFFNKNWWKKIEFCYQNYGLTPLQKSDFLVLWKMDIFVSLKRLVLFLQLHFTLFLAFFTKNWWKKTRTFWSKLWLNPLKKRSIFDSFKNGHLF